MADLREDAITRLLQIEGGFVVDHAGPTRFGITLKTLLDDPALVARLELDLDKDGDMDVADMQLWTEEDARRFYRDLWDQTGMVEFEAKSQVAMKLFDMIVHMGKYQAVKILQRALRAVIPASTAKDDGIIGPKTRALFGIGNDWVLVAACRSEVAGFYRMLAAINPEKYGKYLEGWLNRAYT